MAHTAGWITLLLGLTVALVGALMIKSAKPGRSEGSAVIYRIRGFYAFGLIGVLSVVLTVTLPLAPYPRADDPPPEVRIEVVGKMWSWELKGPDGAAAGSIVLPAGKPVEFAVNTVDVTHGFGIYDDAGTLLIQTQAMPGYENLLRCSFDQPGRYHVLCMEYCGLAHHLMSSSFEVR